MNALATPPVPYRVAPLPEWYSLLTGGCDAWMRSLPLPYRTEWPRYLNQYAIDKWSRCMDAVATAPVPTEWSPCLDAVATAPVLYRVVAMLECGRYAPVPSGRDAWMRSLPLQYCTGWPRYLEEYLEEVP